MAKTDRAALRQKIQGLAGLSEEERAALLELTAVKRYGLVWEERTEEVEERLREELPVLIEDGELRIENSADAPNHILIEGDNLEALTALSSAPCPKPSTRPTRTCCPGRRWQERTKLPDRREWPASLMSKPTMKDDMVNKVVQHPLKKVVQI